MSAGGRFSNNTQGVGGNVAPFNLGSMRVALASDGVTKIAQHAAAPISDYDDSFAFVPGVSSGNMRVTAVIYRDPGYQPKANHEIEIILGCRTSSGGDRRWIECMWNANGATDIMNLDGGPSDFSIIGASTGMIAAPRDGDVWVAELNRATNTVRWWVNGVLGCESTNPLISNLGTGAGIAAFRRPGDTDSAALGFRSFRCEAF